MKKIIIIGNGGTGKSTLGHKLSKILQLKVYHLDRYTFKPGWVRVEEEEFKKTLYKILDEKEWIIEGWSYHSTMERRLHVADTVIYLKFPVHVCYWHAFVRHLKYSFRQNEFDPDNSLMILKTGKMIKAMWKVHKEYEPELRNMLKNLHDKKILIFKNRKAVNIFLNNLKTAEIEFSNV